MRWGGTTIFGGTGGKYVQTFDGGGGSRDFQMPQNSPLIFSEGRAEFERHALDIDPHPTQRVVRGSGDRTVVDHSFLLRHHRYANMYVQPLGCSATSGGLTCQDLSQPLIPPPQGTRLVFKSGTRDAVGLRRWAELGFEFLLNPYEEYSGTWSSRPGMSTNMSTNGMTFILRMKSYLLTVMPENGGAQQVQNGMKLVLVPFSQYQPLTATEYTNYGFVAENILGQVCLPTGTGRFQPPPSPPSPPSPPPLPPNVGCLFISCEVLSDEEVARLEAAALLEHAVSAASAARRAGSALGTLLLAGVSASALSGRSTRR